MDLASCDCCDGDILYSFNIKEINFPREKMKEIKGWRKESKRGTSMGGQGETGKKRKMR